MKDRYLGAFWELILEEGHHDLCKIPHRCIKRLSVDLLQELKPEIKSLLIEVGLQVQMDIKQVVIFGDSHTRIGVPSSPIALRLLFALWLPFSNEPTGIQNPEDKFFIDFIFAEYGFDELGLLSDIAASLEHLNQNVESYVLDWRNLLEHFVDKLLLLGNILYHCCTWILQSLLHTFLVYMLRKLINN